MHDSGQFTESTLRKVYVRVAFLFRLCYVRYAYIVVLVKYLVLFEV